MINIKGATMTVLFSTPVRDRESGRLFLELLMETAPQFVPEKYNYYEPLKNVFDPEKLDEALQHWHDSFLWRRSKPSISGSVLVGFRNVHDKLSLRLPVKALDLQTVARLWKALQKSFGVDLACVQVWTDADTADIEYYKTHTMPFSTLTTHDLREGLPDEPWAMLFGPPYVELFGRERLLSTPAARVEPMGEGIYVQLTDDPTDVAKNRDEYLAAQRAAKEHLDRDAFRGISASGKCRVPEFFLVAH